MPQVAVIIPAWNEEERIADTVRSALCIPKVDNVIVIDDGSNDGTVAKAIEAGASVIKQPFHQGKGQAMLAGIGVTHADVLLFLDADLGNSAVHAQALLTPVLAGEVDMAIAHLPAGSGGGLGLTRSLARWGIRTLTGWQTQSPLSGQRAIRREVLQQVGIAPGWGAEVGLTVDALRQGYRVCEVKVPLRHRQTAGDLAGYMHRGGQFMAIARTLLGRWYGRSLVARN